MASYGSLRESSNSPSAARPPLKLAAVLQLGVAIGCVVGATVATYTATRAVAPSSARAARLLIAPTGSPTSAAQLRSSTASAPRYVTLATTLYAQARTSDRISRFPLRLLAGST